MSVKIYISNVQILKMYVFIMCTTKHIHNRKFKKVKDETLKLNISIKVQNKSNVTRYSSLFWKVLV